MPRLYKEIAVLTFFSLVSASAHAGAYLFADESNGVDIVTHPNTYTGNAGVVTVRICIDPASPNAAQMVNSIQNNINIYNQMLPTTGNLKLGSGNNVPTGALDFESIALHEIGHCLGMAHINAASESMLSGNNQNYTKATDGANNVFDINPGPDGKIGSSDDVRGDDQNLVWFRKSNNDPFTIDTVIDSTTYSRNLADLPGGHSFAANADRAVATLLGHGSSEAVMQQGTYYDEAQRTLGHDDVATLRYAGSGLNESAVVTNNPNTKDNYTIALEYAGITTTNCDISLRMTSTASLAFCAAGGELMASGHARITTASIEFGQAYNWFFNSPNTAPVLNATGNLSLTEGDTLVVPISASDVDGNALAFSASGLPAFASLVDNNNGTATLTLEPMVGDASLNSITLTVTDNGVPAMLDNELVELNVAALDTDMDGISDYDEINLYATSPTKADTDGDFINDGVEVSNGSNPLDIFDWPNLADGDIAPLGKPDGLTNAADYLVMQRIVLGEISATSLELSHADLYPAGAPDGVINLQDLILLQPLLQ